MSDSTQTTNEKRGMVLAYLESATAKVTDPEELEKRDRLLSLVAVTENREQLQWAATQLLQMGIA